MRGSCLVALLAACCLAEAKETSVSDSASIEASIYKQKLSAALDLSTPPQSAPINKEQVDAILDQVSKSLLTLSRRKCSPSIVLAITSQMKTLIDALPSQTGGFFTSLTKAWIGSGDKAVANTYFQLKRARYGPVELSVADTTRVVTAMGVCETFAKSANIDLSQTGYLATATEASCGCGVYTPPPMVFGRKPGCKPPCPCPRPCPTPTPCPCPTPRPCPTPCPCPCPKPPCCDPAPCGCLPAGSGQAVANSLLPLLGCQNAPLVRLLFACLEKTPGFFCSALQWVFLSAIVVDTLIVVFSGLALYSLGACARGTLESIGRMFGISTIFPIFLTFFVKLILLGLAYLLFVPTCCVEQLIEKLLSLIGAISTLLPFIRPFLASGFLKNSIPSEAFSAFESASTKGIQEIDELLEKDFGFQQKTIGGPTAQSIQGLISSIGERISNSANREEALALVRSVLDGVLGLDPALTQGSQPLAALIQSVSSHLGTIGQSKTAQDSEQIVRDLQHAANRLQIIAGGPEEINVITSDQQVSSFYGEVLEGLKLHGEEFIEAQMRELSAEGNEDNQSTWTEKVNILQNLAANVF